MHLWQLDIVDGDHLVDRGAVNDGRDRTDAPYPRTAISRVGSRTAAPCGIDACFWLPTWSRFRWPAPLNPLSGFLTRNDVLDMGYEMRSRLDRRPSRKREVNRGAAVALVTDA